ncbi:MAG: lysophospholipid acyltransferase family protein [Anaerolineales bacterium]|jgi:1-acyl-sn-glycerol-3-phosphate acyltransferase
MRRTLQAIILFLFRSLTRLEIRHLERLPRTGGVLLVGNHLGILDGPLYFAVLPRQDATGLAAKKYKRYPPIRWFVNRAGVIWIEQESADLHALRAAREHMRSGGLLGIAPEGTRSPTGQLIQGKPGAAFLAMNAPDIPIVPAAVTGTAGIFRQLLRLHQPHITLTFGEPFHLPALDRKARDAALLQTTDEMMCRIAALLPPAYRGVYANHPRLLELLAEPPEAPANHQPAVYTR